MIRRSLLISATIILIGVIAVGGTQLLIATDQAAKEDAQFKKDVKQRLEMIEDRLSSIERKLKFP